MGIGAFSHAASGIHRRLSDFIHAVVVCRRDEAVRGWRNWIREDPMVHPYRWLRPDLVLPAPFLQCRSFSQDGDRWSVKVDDQDLGGHLDTTFRGWSSTLAARVRLVISRLVLIFALPLDFPW